MQARRLSPGVRELTYERLDALPMAFEPGQWVNVLVPAAVASAFERVDETTPGLSSAPSLREDLRTKRSYSIASPPNGSPRFDLAVTRVQGGPVSSWLHEVELGGVLAFTGPQGFFTRPAADGPPSLFVATGTGITPMRAMVKAAVAAAARAPLWILLGVRREEDALYADEFEALARHYPFIRFEVSLSQPRGDWSGRRGYVQAHVRALWEALAAGTAERPHVYVCGLQRMVGSVRELLRKDMGLSRELVHSERYD